MGGKGVKWKERERNVRKEREGKGRKGKEDSEGGKGRKREGRREVKGSFYKCQNTQN